jgi:hypothetical protein
MLFPVAGFIGAFVGVVIGVVNYVIAVPIVEASLRRLDRSQTAVEREDFERRISLMRRLVLGIDIVFFSAVGYWIGRTVGGQ